MKFSELLENNEVGPISWRPLGLVNVEGGLLEIAARAFSRNCGPSPRESSLGEVVWPDCSDDCGRQEGNYAQLFSGDGDGVYTVLSLSVDGEDFGAAVIFDSPWTSPAPVWHRLQSEQPPNHLGNSRASALNDFADTTAYSFGEIRSDGMIAFGDSVDWNSPNSLVTIRDLTVAEYSIFAFCEPSCRSEETELPGFASLRQDPEVRTLAVAQTQQIYGFSGSQDPEAPRPRVVMILPNDSPVSTLLRREARRLRVEDYLVTHMTSTVMSNVRPRHLEAIWTNAEFLGSQGHRDESLSYLLQAAWLGDDDAIPQLLRHAEVVRGRERGLLARRLINAEWSLPAGTGLPSSASLPKKNARGGL